MKRKMNVLITGGAGFIGSHLCDLLISNGYRVTALDDLSTGSLDNIRHLTDKSQFQFVRETILNSQVLDQLSSQADIIIHLAAAVGVKLIIENPVHTISTNILGTEAVLSTANRYGCKVMIASSSEVYGKGIRVPFSEDDDCLVGPTSHNRWAYATSKTVDEFLGLAYYQQYNLPVVIMRFFNTVGPRQTGRYGMVVPRFIRQALQDEPLTVYGDGTQSRCFADISDVAIAVKQLMETPDAVGEVINIGSTEEITIKDLATQVIKLIGSNSKIKFIPYDQAYSPGFEDMMRRVPSVDKLYSLIDFFPKKPFDEILLRVIKYEKELLNLNGDFS
jgi:UDP-glucose 4-epimerase